MVEYSGKRFKQVVTLEIEYTEAFDGYPAAPSEWAWEDLTTETVTVLAAGPVQEVNDD